MSVTTVLRSMKLRALFGLIACVGMASAQAGTMLIENFDNISTLASSGWVLINNSSPVGTTGWFQGNTGVFTSQSGAPDSYIAANFNNAAAGGDISNWLISPELTFANGDTIEFYTRTETDAPAADRLELRLSSNGSSTNVGSSDTSVGDFSTLLLTINPTLLPSGYPQSWTLYSATLSGLGSPTTGRFAFRYDVPDTSTNADYIGIDTVTVTSPSVIPEPATLTMVGVGLALMACQRRRPTNRS